LPTPYFELKAFAHASCFLMSVGDTLGLIRDMATTKSSNITGSLEGSCRHTCIATCNLHLGIEGSGFKANCESQWEDSHHPSGDGRVGPAGQCVTGVPHAETLQACCVMALADQNRGSYMHTQTANRRTGRGVHFHVLCTEGTRA